MKLEIGETYTVLHERKGAFVAKVIRDGEWVELELVDGNVVFMSSNNSINKGEKMTVLKSFCKFTLLAE